MDGRDFGGYHDSAILKRVTLDHDGEFCATCHEPLKKGSKVDTRDKVHFFCDSDCERKDYLKREGRSA